MAGPGTIGPESFPHSADGMRDHRRLLQPSHFMTTVDERILLDFDLRDPVHQTGVPVVVDFKKKGDQLGGVFCRDSQADRPVRERQGTVR